MKKIVKDIVKYVDEHIEVVSAVASIISLLFIWAFKMGTYLYCKGCYDFWNIPVEYIAINYQNILYKFLVTVGGVFLFIGFSNIYTFLWIKVREIENRKVRIRKRVILILVIPFLVIVFEVIYLLSQFSLMEVLAYVFYMPKFFWGITALITLMVAPCVGLSGQFIIDKYKEKDTIDQETLENDNKKTMVYGIVIGIAFLGSLIGLSYSIYDIGKNSIAGKHKVDMVYIENNSYVIVGQYEDNWILKECFVDGEEVLINKSHYMFEDIVGKDVVLKELEKGIEECLISQAEYEKITGE
ncbi:MAG: hypothetical protein IJF03_12450 [Lachnospiraceae bacterium]|nr:hypothetical protein [Lachnospiraceae bacterium]